MVSLRIHGRGVGPVGLRSQRLPPHPAAGANGPPARCLSRPPGQETITCRPPTDPLRGALQPHRPGGLRGLQPAALRFLSTGLGAGTAPLSGRLLPGPGPPFSLVRPGLRPFAGPVSRADRPPLLRQPERLRRGSAGGHRRALPAQQRRGCRGRRAAGPGGCAGLLAGGQRAKVDMESDPARTDFSRRLAPLCGPSDPPLALPDHPHVPLQAPVPDPAPARCTPGGNLVERFLAG